MAVHQWSSPAQHPWMKHSHSHPMPRWYSTHGTLAGLHSRARPLWNRLRWAEQSLLTESCYRGKLAARRSKVELHSRWQQTAACLSRPLRSSSMMDHYRCKSAVKCLTARLLLSQQSQGRCLSRRPKPSSMLSQPHCKSAGRCLTESRQSNQQPRARCLWRPLKLRGVV